ncbi:MAG: type II toxin-antitoxin system Phd/YefM family antitoxin [Oscillospiraceae bacterium]|nr:type II toxin-antitoxin system Phd/YefM family antitoxin [Oscillospiraceae bacterium]
MIRPVEDLQKNFSDLRQYCKEFNKPVFLTEDGKGEFVLMSHEHYEAMQEELDLTVALFESQLEFAEDGKSYSMDEVDLMLREVIDEPAKYREQAA